MRYVNSYQNPGVNLSTDDFGLLNEDIDGIEDFLNNNVEGVQIKPEAAAFVEAILQDCDSDQEVDFDLKNINKLTNVCAKNIFSELENGIYKEDIIKPEVVLNLNGFQSLELNFSEHILSLFNNSQIFNYIIKNENLQNTNAITVGAETTLNNNYLNQASELSIARTMIHELVHAYLNLLYNNPFSVDNGIDFKLKMEQFAQDNGFNPNGSNVEQNIFQHAFMGNYIDAMAYALYEWDKNYGTGLDNNSINSPNDLLGWQYYRAMAFSGNFTTDQSGNLLNSSDTFIELIPNESQRQQIANIVFNELKSNNNAEGTNCN